MHIVDIKHSHLLPLHFRFFGGLAIVFGILLAQPGDYGILSWIFSFAGVLFGILLLTSRYGIQIDPDEKRYKEYIQILGFRKGAWKSYTRFEKIFVNAVLSSQVISTRANHKTDFHSKEYRAYLKLDDGTKLELDEDSSKDRLMSRVAAYNQLLKTEITDNALLK